MIPKPLDKIADVELRDVLTHIQEESLGRALELSAAPSASAPLLQDNEVGKYNNKYYRRIGSQIFEVTPSSVINIT
jgi:hypothetical protein